MQPARCIKQASKAYVFSPRTGSMGGVNRGAVLLSIANPLRAAAPSTIPYLHVITHICVDGCCCLAAHAAVAIASFVIGQDFPGPDFSDAVLPVGDRIQHNRTSWRQHYFVFPWNCAVRLDVDARHGHDLKHSPGSLFAQEVYSFQHVWFGGARCSLRPHNFVAHASSTASAAADVSNFQHHVVLQLDAPEKLGVHWRQLCKRTHQQFGDGQEVPRVRTIRAFAVPAKLAVLAVLLVASLAANGWFVYKNRNKIQMLRQQLAEQELGGGRRQQTVAMVANPLARRSSGRQTAGRVAGRATAAAAAFLPPQEQSASAYAEPASDGVSTYQSGASYAPVYAVYAGSTPAAPAAGVPLDSHNYVLDTSA